MFCHSMPMQSNTSVISMFWFIPVAIAINHVNVKCALFPQTAGSIQEVSCSIHGIIAYNLVTGPDVIWFLHHLPCKLSASGGVYSINGDFFSICFVVLFQLRCCYFQSYELEYLEKEIRHIPITVCLAMRYVLFQEYLEPFVNLRVLRCITRCWCLQNAA